MLQTTLSPPTIQPVEWANEVYQTPTEWNTTPAVNSSNSITAQQTRAVPSEQSDSLDEQQKNELVKKLNTTLQTFDTNVSLEWNDKIKRTVIRVVDNDTGKVVRQIPSEDLLRLSERITELLGALYDKKM